MSQGLLFKLRPGVVGICMSSMALTPLALPSPARGDAFWREAKAYTASIVGAYEAAVAALNDAKDNLEMAAALLEQANNAVATAGAGATGALAATVKLVAGELKVATAEVALATEAVVVALAAATAFLGGTAVGQGGDWVISWCWDPIEPHATADLSYSSPTDAELDAMVADMISSVIQRPLTRADFDLADTIVPGSGTASWNYMRSSVRNFVIGLRGAAAFMDNRCGDVLRASDDLQAALVTYTGDTQGFVGVFEGLATFTGEPMVALQDATTGLDALEPLVPLFDDPAAMQAAIDLARSGVSLGETGLADAGDGTGNPVMLDGEFFRPVTLADFEGFLSDCAVLGADCLPQAEVIATDRLMSLLGATFDGSPSIAAEIAAWDALGDTGNEAALFAAAGGVLKVSEVLTTAIPNHWDRIDLSQSPLVLGCQCPADIDGDGDADVSDFFAFILAFAAGDPAADINGDGSVDVGDFFAFVVAFAAGCP